MHKVNLSRTFENKYMKAFLKEILMDIPKKNKIVSKQECYIVYNNDEELSNITTAFAAILTERKLVDYLYEYCNIQQMKEEAVSDFIEAFFVVNPNFISYSLTITKIKLSMYIQFNDELNIETFTLFNMTNFNKDMDSLISDVYILESIYAITKSGVMGMTSAFQKIIELENLIKDKPKEDIKDFKIYNEDGIKCITENKIQINEEYLKEKYGIELDSNLKEVEKIFILIWLIRPSRVILFSSISEDIRNTLVNSGKTFGPALGTIKFYNANEPKPIN